MAKSKNKKDHKKRVAARNSRLKNDKRAAEKFQMNFIKDLIKKEQESGLFDNVEAGPSGVELEESVVESEDVEVFKED